MQICTEMRIIRSVVMKPIILTGSLNLFMFMVARVMSLIRNISKVFDHFYFWMTTFVRFGRHYSRNIIQCNTTTL